MQNSGDRHQAVAQTPVIPGVRSCWRRQEGVRELQGVVLALEQPSQQGYFKAGHGSPVQSLFFRGVGTPSIPKEAPAPLCSTPHTGSCAAETSPSHGINRLQAERLPSHPAAAGGSCWQGGAQRVLTAPSAGSSCAVSSWEDAAVGQV